MKGPKVVGAAMIITVVMATSLSGLSVASADKPAPTVDPSKAEQEQQWDAASRDRATVPEAAPMGPFDNNYNLHKDKYIDFGGAHVRMYLDSNWVGYPGLPLNEQGKMKDGTARVSWLGSNPYNCYWMRLDGRFSATGVSVSVFGIGVPSGGGSTGYTGPARYNTWSETHYFGEDFVHFYGIEIYRVTHAQTGWIRFFQGYPLYNFTASDSDYN